MSPGSQKRTTFLVKVHFGPGEVDKYTTNPRCHLGQQRVLPLQGDTFKGTELVALYPDAGPTLFLLHGIRLHSCGKTGRRNSLGVVERPRNKTNLCGSYSLYPQLSRLPLRQQESLQFPTTVGVRIQSRALAGRVYTFTLV